MKRPLPDYHIHTSATEDAANTLMEMAESAAARGLREIAVTDHYILGYKKYKVTASILKQHRLDATAIYERFGVTVRVGAEVDYFDDHVPEIERFLKSFDFDIIIGAAHFVDGCGIAAEDGAKELFGMYDPLTAFRRSLMSLEKAAMSGLFDIMAHPDIFRKFYDGSAGGIPFDSYAEEADQAAQAILRAGVGFEVNCRGFSHAAATQYPGDEFLALLKKTGLETVTIGSDAHQIEGVGVNLDRGFEALKRAGFSHLTLFEKREPVKVPTSEFHAPVTNGSIHSHHMNKENS